MNVHSNRVARMGLGMMVCLMIVFSFSPAAHADLSTSQAQAEINASQLAKIQALLQLVDQLRAQLLALQGTVAVAPNSCTQIKNLLTLGSTDATTNGDVSKLQKFLAYNDYYNYGTVTGYFGQVTLDAVKKWQDTENFYEPYGEIAGRGVIGPRSQAKIAESCNGVIINQKAVTSTANSFTLTGTAKNATAIFIALVAPYTSGPTDWRTVYENGLYIAFTGDTSTKVVNGKWNAQFTGVRSGEYEVRVYDNSSPTEQKLLHTQILTVAAPEIINFSVRSGPKTITLGVGQKATDGGITITASDVFLTNGLSGSVRASFIVQPAGFNAGSYSSGLGEYVSEGGGGFSDLKALNKTIKFKVTGISTSMNTVTFIAEDGGLNGEITL